ncbi:MAG: hypothetical protein ACE5IY_10270 [bacterium]
MKQHRGYDADWDGRDQHGLEVGSGLYSVRIVAGESTDSKKIVLLK